MNLIVTVSLDLVGQGAALVRGRWRAHQCFIPSAQGHGGMGFSTQNDAGDGGVLTRGKTRRRTVSHWLMAMASSSPSSVMVKVALWWSSSSGAPSYSGGAAQVSFSDGRFGAGRFEAAWLRWQFAKEAPTHFDSHGGATGGSLYRGKCPV
jgi:hypothetical protein